MSCLCTAPSTSHILEHSNIFINIMVNDLACVAGSPERRVAVGAPAIEFGVLVVRVRESLPERLMFADICVLSVDAKF